MESQSVFMKTARKALVDLIALQDDQAAAKAIEKNPKLLIDYDFEAKRDSRSGEISPYSFLMSQAPSDMARLVAQSIDLEPIEWVNLRLALSLAHQGALSNLDSSGKDRACESIGRFVAGLQKNASLARASENWKEQLDTALIQCLVQSTPKARWGVASSEDAMTWVDSWLSLVSSASAKRESGQLGPWRDDFHTYEQEELAMSMLDQFTDLARRSGDRIIEIDRIYRGNSELNPGRDQSRAQLIDQTLGVLSVLNMGWTAACTSGFLDGELFAKAFAGKMWSWTRSSAFNSGAQGVGFDSNQRQLIFDALPKDLLAKSIDSEEWSDPIRSHIESAILRAGSESANDSGRSGAAIRRMAL